MFFTMDSFPPISAVERCEALRAAHVLDRLREAVERCQERLDNYNGEALLGAKKPRNAKCIGLVSQKGFLIECLFVHKERLDIFFKVSDKSRALFCND